jgi:hypothetical protein
MTDRASEQEGRDARVVGRIRPGRPATGFDPATDPVRWEHMVGQVMAAAQPGLVRRRQPGPLDVLGHWMRPVLAAAASIGVVASATLLSVGARPDIAEAAVPTLAEAILATDLADWVESGEVPEVQSLLETFGGSEP